MTRSIKAVLYFLFLAVVIMSCQQEEVIINDTRGETLDSMSPLADLVGQTSLNDGSGDNIIDNSSCISVILPVTVVANGTELVIETSEDYVLIERIFDESPDDVDVLQIIYPIEVMLPDYSVEEISSDSDLADITEDCLEGGEDLDIECIDFKYPVSVSVYDSENLVADIVEVTSDQAMIDFLVSLDEKSVFSFKYPLTMILTDGSEIVVNSNIELEAIIDEVDDTCDEDDDFDYNDDDIDTSEFNEIIASTAWVVSYYSDGTYDASAFNSMVFSFREDELATVLYNNLIIEGGWDIYGDDGELELELDFISDHPFDLLEAEEWDVLSYDNSTIELSYEKEDGSIILLTFEATDEPGTPPPAVAEYLVAGEWIVAQYKQGELDETQVYAGYKINFSADATLAFYNDSQSENGVWEEVRNIEEHLLVLDFGSSIPEFEKLAEEWEVVNYNETRIELTIYDVDIESSKSLLLEKL